MWCLTAHSYDKHWLKFKCTIVIYSCIPLGEKYCYNETRLTHIKEFEFKQCIVCFYLGHFDKTSTNSFLVKIYVCIIFKTITCKLQVVTRVVSAVHRKCQTCKKQYLFGKNATFLVSRILMTEWMSNFYNSKVLQAKV